MTAVIFDEARAFAFVVGGIGAGGFVHATSGLPTGFGEGAVVAATLMTTYGLRTNADGSQRLVRASAGGAETGSSSAQGGVSSRGAGDSAQADRAWPHFQGDPP